MIAALNRVVDVIEADLASDVDIATLSSELGTTEYHLRRMFSSLAGMPLSEYIRRRRMTVAVADLVGDGDLLDIAVRFGYSSTEAFGRAFRAVHGISPGDARRHGGPFHTQPRLRFRLTVEGNTTMHTRIVERPAFRLVGHTTRVPLIHRGASADIQAFIGSLPATEHPRLKSLSTAEPAGLLQVSADVDPDYTEGSELTYLHGVAVDAGDEVPDDLEVIEVPAGYWAVFRSEGAHPDALQDTWAATATDWFPSNPWRLRPGPSIVSVLDRADDFSIATTELWLPVEGA